MSTQWVRFSGDSGWKNKGTKTGEIHCMPIHAHAMQESALMLDFPKQED